jgi:two-component system, chemotaxis family, response regulator Rcp1
MTATVNESARGTARPQPWSLPMPTTRVEPIEMQPWSLPMPNATRGEPIEILLVEDDPGDAKRTMDALKDGRLRNRITHVEDGMEAMAYLWREGEYADAPRPDLILLDLHMPRMNGQEVLAEVKADPDLRRIPVVMMTASAQEKDILAAYNLHVNSYVVKPVDMDQLISAVRSIEHFWFTIVKLPAA